MENQQSRNHQKNNQGIWQKMIEKLFTSKNRVKLLEYFIIEKKSGKLREISRKTKIPVSAVSRELRNLLQLNIIKKDKDNFGLNEECNFLPDLKDIFIKTDAIAYPIKEGLKKLDLDFALVFGSFAKGDYSSESDIDLLIVGNVKQSEVFRLLRPVEEKIEREISSIVWNIEEFKKRKKSSLVRDILNKKIIMVIGEENELRKIAK